MGFQHGLSGLKTASTNLDVIGNNVANSNTVGFKQSQAQFSDVMASALGGGGSNQIGLGSQLANVAQQFTQGNITTTNNPLDIAINGDGFFRMDNGGAISYSRAGQFHLDKDGFIVNGSNINVTGFLPDASGNLITAQPSNLQLATADLPPRATSSFTNGFNLDSRTVIPAPVVPFNSTNPVSYDSSTSGSVFDSLGNSHVLTLFFKKTDSLLSTWDTFATLDGANNVDMGAGIGTQIGIAYDSQGAFVPMAPPQVVVALGNGALDLDFSLNLDDSTQFGSNFGVNSITQDGFSSGSLAGFDIDADGTVQGNFTNGETNILGQVVLASFSNPGGLTALGNGQWAESSDSGQPLVGAPLTGALGALQSAAVEDSNVDLTGELVSMITAQRIYQANAKTIETQDAILQTLVNL